MALALHGGPKTTHKMPTSVPSAMFIKPEGLSYTAALMELALHGALETTREMPAHYDECNGHQT